MVKKSCLAMTVVGVIGLMQLELPASAQSTTFYCDTSGNVPVTRIKTPHGDETFILWRNSFGRAYSTVRRCQEVSTRFERQRLRGRLYLTSRANVNGHPVICQTESAEGSCNRNNILVTLLRGSDHREALGRLTAFQKGASTNPIELSGDPSDASTPSKISSGSEQSDEPPDLSGDHWSQAKNGELYFNLGAAVNTPDTESSNRSSVYKRDNISLPSASPRKNPSKSPPLPPGYKF
jgi:Circadian oscillating protein COP23